MSDSGFDREKFQRELKDRAFEIILFCRSLPNEEEFRIIKRQLIRSATSAAANYSASNRGKSNPDILYKRKLVEEELDESLFWLEFLLRLQPNSNDELGVFFEDGERFLKINVNSIKALR